MSLIAHWPLTGTLEDYSGKDTQLTNYGATIDSSGKIGKCYSFNGETDYMVSSEVITTSVNHFSVSFWIYPITSGFVFGPKSYGYDHKIGYDSVSEIIYVGITESSDLNNRNRPSSNNSVPINKWSHISVVMDDLNIKIYINGLLDSEYTEAVPVAPFSGQWDWGRRPTNTNYITGKINDIRIYDHLLSAKEINEISKSKILHFTFNDFQEPTENLINLNFSHLNKGEYQDYPDTKGGTFRVTNLDNNKYEILALTDMSSQQQISLSNSFMWYDGEYITLSAVIHDNYLAEGSTAGWGLSRTGYGSNNHIYQEGYETYTYLGAWGGLDQSSSVGIRITWTDGLIVKAGSKIVFSNFQAERKDHATPFAENSRTGIVKDISGYHNNATLDLATTPTWVEESRIGKGNYIFNGSQDIALNHSNFTLSKDITISMWIKPYSYLGLDASATCLIAKRYNGDFEITLRDNDLTIYHGDGVDYVSAWRDTAVIDLNVWQHIVIVRDINNQTYSVYKNGNLFSSSVFSIIPSRVSDILNIGSRGGSRMFDGLIDDVRIYTTPLSELEVKKLYQTRVSLDSSGNLHINFLKESVVI